MIPWELIDVARIPGGGGELRLFRRDTEFSIRTSRFELMNSRVHGSEEDLARLTLTELEGLRAARILIGGLGMGFTVAAALSLLPPDGRIVTAEFVPEVIEWNRGVLAHLSDHALADPRVSVLSVDVVKVIRKARAMYDAIILDVDNGPEGLMRKGNDRLYTPEGLAAARIALRPGGILSVWSASPDPAFTERLKRAKFQVEETKVRAHRARAGMKHTIWVATSVDDQEPEA